MTPLEPKPRHPAAGQHRTNRTKKWLRALVWFQVCVYNLLSFAGGLCFPFPLGLSVESSEYLTIVGIPYDFGRVTAQIREITSSC
jgi:hypothetical protein